jgi:hypothetical protein
MVLYHMELSQQGCYIGVYTREIPLLLSIGNFENNKWVSLPGVSKTKVSFEDKDTHNCFKSIQVMKFWCIENGEKKMTLILTEIGLNGISMAADSAVVHSGGGRTIVRLNAAQKLQSVPYLNAGISCWGQGRISGTPTDQWLINFISSNSRRRTLRGFANELARQLNIQQPPSITGSLGFHLAGYENYNGTLTPSFYHIHDGPSTTLQQRGINVNSNRFNANHDFPPNLYANISRNYYYITRNGDYQFYAQLFSLLNNFFNCLNLMHSIRIPRSHNLSDRAEYLIFQIRTISEIYRISNLIPGIGGDINYLTINSAGIHSQGVKHYP